MSAKIGILAINQDIQSEPRTFVKRCVAELLVRRLLAEWIGRRMVRMVAVHGLKEELPRRAYIPERMPPVEVPGTYFKDPLRPNKPLGEILDAHLKRGNWRGEPLGYTVKELLR